MTFEPEMMQAILISVFSGLIIVIITGFWRLLSTIRDNQYKVTHLDEKINRLEGDFDVVKKKLESLTNALN